MTDKKAMAIKDQPFTIRTLENLIRTPTVPVRYRNSETGVQDMWSAVLMGQEIGIGPMTAIHNIFLVNGEASMQGKLMTALVHRAGHRLRVEIGADSATCTAFRRQPDGSEIEAGSFTFSKEDAERAGLLDKDNWKNYPNVMYAWRAVSQACRFVFPELLLGVAMYTPDEVGLDVPVEPFDLDIEVDVLDESPNAG